METRQDILTLAEEIAESVLELSQSQNPPNLPCFALKKAYY